MWVLEDNPLMNVLKEVQEEHLRALGLQLFGWDGLTQPHTWVCKHY